MIARGAEKKKASRARVDLKPVLRRTGDDPGRALLFRIRPDRTVEALLE